MTGLVSVIPEEVEPEVSLCRMIAMNQTDSISAP